MDSPDYPAAHSMDSCWFGVDKDGRVGFFDTGDSGAMPIRGVTEHAAELTRERIARAVPEGETLFDLRGRILPFWKRNLMRNTYGGGDWPVLMFLDSLDSVRQAIARGRAIALRAKEGAAVLWELISDSQYRRLHQEGKELCRGCFLQFDLGEEPPYFGADVPANMARHGVYVYHKLGGSTANPYGQFEAPVAPIHVDQLPPPLRTRLKEVLFATISFADTPVFQPAEHLPCRSEDSTYTDLSGRMHPFREDEPDDSPEEYMQRLDDVLGPDDEAPPF
jgi:hypothetical protein